MKLLAILVDDDKDEGHKCGTFVRKQKNHHDRRETVGTWTDNEFHFHPFSDATDEERDEMAGFVNGRFTQAFNREITRKEKS